MIKVANNLRKLAATHSIPSEEEYLMSFWNDRMAGMTPHPHENRNLTADDINKTVLQFAAMNINDAARQAKSVSRKGMLDGKKLKDKDIAFGPGTATALAASTIAYLRALGITGISLGQHPLVTSDSRKNLSSAALTLLDRSEADKRLDELLAERKKEMGFLSRIFTSDKNIVDSLSKNPNIAKQIQTLIKEHTLGVAAPGADYKAVAKMYKQLSDAAKKRYTGTYKNPAISHILDTKKDLKKQIEMQSKLINEAYPNAGIFADNLAKAEE